MNTVASNSDLNMAVLPRPVRAPSADLSRALLIDPFRAPFIDLIAALFSDLMWQIYKGFSEVGYARIIPEKSGPAVKRVGKSLTLNAKQCKLASDLLLCFAAEKRIALLNWLSRLILMRVIQIHGDT